MKIPLVGASNPMRSLPFDTQRTINLFPVLDQQGKEVAALYGTPGLSLFATCGNGPIRGVFNSTKGRAFVVSGNTFYEITSAGAVSLLGTLLSLSGAVTIDENPTQLAICDGTKVYILTYATNVFAVVSDADLPSAGTLTFIDSYFVINKNSTGSFYISSPNDGTAWAALDFASAESSPDNISRVLNAVGQLWLFGTKTTEIFTDTGAASFPFQRISGAKLEVGILAPYSAIPADNSVIWLGQDSYGSGIVYRAQGFSPVRISNDAVEYAIQQATSPTTMRAYTYQQEGHAFYVLTDGGLATTWVYDLTTQLWHERAYLNTSGLYEQHLGNCGMYAFSKQLVGSRLTGAIYQLSLDVYSDNGSPLRRERIHPHVSNENKQLRFNSLEIAMETGVGLQTGQGSAPVVSLQVSGDQGRTYSSEYQTTIGAVGKYNATARWRRLGISTDIVFKVFMTDPVKCTWIGSYLNS